MPTYEYRCPNGHDFEEFVRTISAAQAELKCPTCGAVAVRKVSGGAGLVFKGSGFYITDYGKDGKKNQPGAARKKDDAGGSGDAATSGKEGSTPKESAAKESATKESATKDSKASGKKDE
ncbi:MAG TPA: zinc ribbon domain-containing protein [Gemmatimonadaceae bacterium]|nr:zinc ribbon domain-containing protein [Gemmatimonadaceae bacterium]